MKARRLFAVLMMIALPIIVNCNAIGWIFNQAIAFPFIAGCACVGLVGGIILFFMII